LRNAGINRKIKLVKDKREKGKKGKVEEKVIR